MYTVIARKYRPQTFGEVVSQEHIKQTLRNAIERNRIAHGYIFSGQRGTGKTTMARLLAKALNCERGLAVEPCGQCASCREIAAGNSVDVIEIDAASNRGIDEIRTLRENVRYAPARDRYKIYIVDEAHQITRDAWNALLKTLEEPPANVLFIFCTTASHAIPATIVSRCQSFRFHNLSFEQTMAQLRRVSTEEGIEATDEALAVMATAGEGSLRDSLSALDQAIACCGRVLDGGLVRALLGVVAAEVLDEVVAAVIAGSSDRMLEVVDRLVREGHDLRNFARELVRHLRNLLVLKTAGADSGLVEASPEARERLAALAESFSEEDLTRLLQLTLSLYSDLHHSAAPRFHTELGLLKLVHARRLVPLEELLVGESAGASGPRSPSGGGSGGRGGSGAGRPSPFEADTARKRTPPPPGGLAPRADSAASATERFLVPPAPRDLAAARSASTAAASAPAVGAALPPPAASQGGFEQALLARLEQMSRKMLAVNIEAATAWRVEETEVAACFPPGSAIHRMITPDDQQLIRNICSELLGRPVAFRIATEASGQAATPPTHPAGGADSPVPGSGSVRDDPQVAEFLRLFGDAIVSVQNLKPPRG
jgi:DNA polymerase-3 subunit gamma/tau